MKKLLRYANGDEYVIGQGAGIFPNGVEPIEELDLEDLKEEEMKELKANLHNKKVRNKFLKKARKIHG